METLLLFCVQELISQAAQILGSVDFLGNPMGLLNDVSEGVSELIKYGNVGGLIRSVTHGVSNSAAKVGVASISASVSVSCCSWQTFSGSCLSLQGRCLTGWGRPWTTDTRASASTSVTTAPPAGSTWWRASTGWLTASSEA